MNSQMIYGIGLAVMGAACAALTVWCATKETKASQMVDEEPAVSVKDKVVRFVKRYPATIISGFMTAAIVICAIAMFKEASLATMVGSGATAIGMIDKHRPQLIDLVAKTQKLPDGTSIVDGSTVNEKHWFMDEFGALFEATPFEMLEHELNFNKTLALSSTLSVYAMHKMYGLKDKDNPFRVNNGRGFSIEKMFDCYQYPWLSLDYSLLNDPEKGDVDYNLNEGRPTYKIEYSCPVENDILE